MIARLRGQLAEKQLQRVVIDVAGVGYDVSVPLSTLYALGEPGASVSLRIHTHVREDAFQLFGFATALEQELFERLIGVSGIGPKVALAMLSGIEPTDLRRAIAHADITRLTAIPGVGKKTAERVVLELKDRLPLPGDEQTAPAVTPLRDDVISALMNLGYPRAACDKAVDAVVASGTAADFEALLRQALRQIAR